MVKSGKYGTQFSAKGRVGESSLPPHSCEIELEGWVLTEKSTMHGYQLVWFYSEVFNVRASSLFFILYAYRIGYLFNHRLSDCTVVPLISYPIPQIPLLKG